MTSAKAFRQAGNFSVGGVFTPVLGPGRGLRRGSFPGLKRGWASENAGRVVFRFTAGRRAAIVTE